VPGPLDDTKRLPTLLGEVWEMVVAYARQETLDPLRRLGRFVVYGTLGSVFLGIGLVLLALGGLRALQTETDGTFDGNWSWAPYGITTAGALLVALLAGSAVGRARRRGRRK
jgi:hypothetical protein